MTRTITRTVEREEFLAYLLVGAIEHYGYGFPEIIKWHCPDERFGEWFAVITDRYDETDPTTWRVDIDTMAKGLGIIKRAFMATCDRGTHYHVADSFECLGFGGDERKELLLADRTNGDDGDYDVIGALAVLECALFGQVIYA